MKTISVYSKKYGHFTSKVDDEDFERIKELGGSWMVNIQRGVRPYVCRWFGPRLVSLHRWILSEPPGIVDHMNQDTLDNRRSNLRVCKTSTNLRNSRLRVTNTSGHAGVCPSQDRWMAYIGVSGKTVFLGYFKKLSDAVNARAAAELRYWSV